MPGKGKGQNILLPYKSRFNTKKDRSREKKAREHIKKTFIYQDIGNFVTEMLKLYLTENIGVIIREFV